MQDMLSEHFQFWTEYMPRSLWHCRSLRFWTKQTRAHMRIFKDFKGSIVDSDVLLDIPMYSFFSFFGAEKRLRPFGFRGAHFGV